MKMVSLQAVVLLAVLVQAAFASSPEKDQTALKQQSVVEQMLIGKWKGGGCDGQFVFHADGRYELSGYGPGASENAGAWKIRGDFLPATLVLICKTSDFDDDTGKTKELKVVRLDDKSFAIEYANQNGSPSGQYRRVK